MNGERKMRKTLLAALVTIIFLAAISPGRLNAANIKFINGNWFNGQGFTPRTAYSLNGLLSFTFSGTTDEIVDLQNGYVIPPFAEAHTHQFLDVMNFKEQIDDYLFKGIFYAKNLNSIPIFTVKVRAFINRPTTIDVSYANGGLTATGGHPVQMFDFLAGQGQLPHVTAKDMPNQAYFIIDNEQDLRKKWQEIKSSKPDFIKTYLEHSEEYELRKNDEKYFGKRGLDPKLLPTIVTTAHRDGLRVSVHISTAADFHAGVIAGVDEISHLPLEQISDADAKLAAKKRIFVVSTTLSHRDAAGIEDLDGINRFNLKLLYGAGVKIAIGTDNMPTGVVEEAENIYRLKAFDNLTLLKLWTENTPQTIFPTRKIGFLKKGYEASFLALKGNPVEDFSAIRKIGLRYKQGQLIKLGETK